MIVPCDKCKRRTHIDLLDAKPGNRLGVNPRAANWERFECWKCYGEGYTVADPAMLRPGSPQRKVSAPR